jgi:hypothetical protein
MKSIAYLLILVIALHTQCGADCLGTTLNTATQPASSSSEKPPCHEETGEAPAPSHEGHSSQHDGNNSCGQTQALESRSDQLSKWSGFSLPVADLTAPIFFDDFALRALSLTALQDERDFSPPRRAITLRI